MNLNLKYLDNTPVEQEYLDAIYPLISAACDAEEQIFIDDLEEYANQLNKS